MKTHSAALGFLIFFSAAALAEERLVSAADPALPLRWALGKQVNVRFSDGFARARLPQADYGGLVVTDLPEGRICLFGRAQGLGPDVPALAGFGRSAEGDICLPREDVRVKVPDSTEGAPKPMPFYATDKKACNWQWRSGKGIGLWTEDCSFESGRWNVVYDEANDWFALQVNGADPYPVLRQFREEGGPEALLPGLKARGLILNDAECVFAPSAEPSMLEGWPEWNVVPVGKRKEAFDASPPDEVPEPPCGELGLAVDAISFFLTHKDRPGRVFHVNLGQDGTMIDLPSLTLRE